MNFSPVKGISGFVELEEQAQGQVLCISTPDFWGDGGAEAILKPKQVAEVRDALTAWLRERGAE
jgi:hypothetical protein